MTLLGPRIAASSHGSRISDLQPADACDAVTCLMKSKTRNDWPRRVEGRDSSLVISGHRDEWMLCLR